MAIVGQRNRLAVNVTVETGGRLKTLPLTIQTEPVFDGKSHLRKARSCGFPGICRSSVSCWQKHVTGRRKILMPTLHAQFEAQVIGS